MRRQVMLVWTGRRATMADISAKRRGSGLGPGAKIPACSATAIASAAQSNHVQIPELQT
jgi:hypothetical protein